MFKTVELPTGMCVIPDQMYVCSEHLCWSKHIIILKLKDKTVNYFGIRRLLCEKS